MEFNEVDKELKKFGNYIIQQSRSNLTKGKRNYTKELYNSLSYKLEESGDGFIIDFFMEDYGAFQDQGVKGVKIFSKWAKYRKLQPRDKKGRFGTYESMGYILANSIKNKGIKATMFFSKPFEAALERLPVELVNSFSLDVEKSILLAQKN